MSTKNLNFIEYQKLTETVSKKPITIVRGEVDIEDNFGRKVFGHNKFIIEGSQFALMKMFNIDSDYQFKNLNQLLNINPNPSLPSKSFKGPRQEDAICLFSVGTGGSGDVFNSVLDVRYNEISVKDIIPFRYTNTSLSAGDADKYFIKKEDNGYTAYYGKKFELEPVLKCLYADGSEVPDNVEATNDDDIDTFIELKLKISNTDCREWFIHKGAGVESARINTLSLLAGFPIEVSPGVTDYVQLKVVTKYNFKNEALENDKELFITYRIYI